MTVSDEVTGIKREVSTTASVPAVLKGQVALITGGTDGIGKACAIGLATLGADLILVGRTPEKGQHAVAEIQAAVPGSQVTFWSYDLSLMASVEQLTAAIQEKAIRLDILVHSAGVMLSRRKLTSEAVETVFATQYLARFLFTRSLLDCFSPHARIVSVSAGGTIPIRLDFNNLNVEKFYNGIYALIHESVANDLFALRFMRDNPAVRFYNYGPFFVQTGLFVDMPVWFKLVLRTFGRLVATSTQVAARDMVALITSNQPSGMYSRHRKLIKPSRYRMNTAVQDRLWDTSLQMVNKALKRSKG